MSDFDVFLNGHLIGQVSKSNGANEPDCAATMRLLPARFRAMFGRRVNHRVGWGDSLRVTLTTQRGHIRGVVAFIPV